LQGIKYDQDKDRWDLVPWTEFKEVVKVLTYGANKYKPDNWKNVENPQDRYFAACQRHLIAWKEGEFKDESTFHHLAHAICCLLFLMWFDKSAGAATEKAG
jgi:hypothetical protein